MKEYQRNQIMQKEMQKLKSENQNLLAQLDSTNNTVQTYRRETQRTKMDNESLAFNRELVKNQENMPKKSSDQGLTSIYMDMDLNHNDLDQGPSYRNKK